MPGEHRVALQLEIGDIGRQAHAQRRRGARGQVAALGRGREERRAIAARAQPLRRCRREHLRVVPREPRVLHHEDHVGTVAAELLGPGGDPRRAQQERMRLASSRGVGRAAARRSPLRTPPCGDCRPATPRSQKVVAITAPSLRCGAAAPARARRRPPRRRSDPAALRRQGHGLDGQSHLSELRRLHVERLLLGRHDALERWPGAGARCPRRS